MSLFLIDIMLFSKHKITLYKLKIDSLLDSLLLLIVTMNLFLIYIMLFILTKQHYVN